MSAIKWIKLPKTKAKGVEYYVQSDGAKYYRLRAMVRGVSYIDAVGVRPEEDVIAIKAILDRNRKTGTGPQSYEQMISADIARKADERKAEEVAKLNTIKALSEKYVDARKARTENSDLSAHDFKTIRSRHTKHIQPFFADTMFKDLKTGEAGQRGKTVWGLVQHMREAAHAAGKSAANKTVKEVVAELGRLWEYANKEGIIGDTKFPGEPVIEEIKLNNKRTNFLTKEQYDQLYAYFTESGNVDMLHSFVLAVCTGMRAGEIHRLTFFQAETGFIYKTKNGKQRYIDGFKHPWSQEVVLQRKAMLPKHGPHDLIFPRRRADASGSLDTARKEPLDAFGTAIEKLGIWTPILPPTDANGNPLPETIKQRADREQQNRNSKIVFHSLRHTFASWLIQTGKLSDAVMRDLMGHSSIQQMERYAHLRPHHLAGATQLLPGGGIATIEGAEQKQLPAS